MAAADYVIKRFDTGPAFTATILDASGAVVNLTGASVKFVMRPMTAIAPTTNLTATIVSAVAGTVSYTPTATDTAIAGMYQAEFHITSSGGVLTTFPTDGYLEVQIEEDLVTPGGARLVGLGEVKDALNFATTDRARDAKLVRMIDQFTPVIESITGPILQRIYQNETHDGGTWAISTRHRPIISVSALTEYRGPIPYPLTQVATPDLGTIYSYMVEPIPGRIVRRTVGGGTTTFPAGPEAVWITYTAGYQVTPQNVSAGLIDLIRIHYQQTQQSNRPQFGGGPDPADNEPGQFIMGFFVPNRVREELAPNRRHPSIA